MKEINITKQGNKFQLLDILNVGSFFLISYNVDVLLCLDLCTISLNWFTPFLTNHQHKILLTTCDVRLFNVSSSLTTLFYLSEFLRWGLMCIIIIILVVIFWTVVIIFIVVSWNTAFRSLYPPTFLRWHHCFSCLSI